ncbi:MAG: CPBP family intramembrane metalloprotease, partial [Lachnospiraceae bacterium]|nr:CPBP family intramembrane metalloprotease [Lachnospiraceae bacterium]
ILYNYKDFIPEKPNYRIVFRPQNIFGYICFGFGIMIFLDVVLTILNLIVPSLFENYMKLMDEVVNVNSTMALIMTVVIAPVAEELIYRGAILKRFMFVHKFWVANILQSLLFGIAHGNMIQGCYAFIFGLLLGMIYKCTGSIISTIIVHMIANGSSYLLGYLQEEGDELPGSLGQTFFLLALVMGIIFFIVGIIYWVRYYINFDENKKDIF